MEKLDNLLESVAKQEEEFKLERSFKGVKHFINNNSKFKLHRDWLVRFFDVLGAENRNSIIIRLESIKSLVEKKLDTKNTK